MSGLKVVVPTTFTDNTLPVLLDDPVLTPGNGSLMLFDWTHPANPAAISGIPANAAQLNNVAWSKAAALLGSGDVNSLAMVVATSGTFGTGGLSLIERSGLGGLHGVTSKASDPGTVYLNLGIPLPIRTYLIANPTHSYFFSVWGRVTRGAVSVTSNHPNVGEYENPVSASSNYLAIMGYTSALNLPANGRAAALSATGPIIDNLNATAWVGTAPSAASMTAAQFLGTGGAFASTASLRQNKHDWIHYRTYVEDLTVSGRSYATVDALDFAQYTAQVLTSGGRYYNDTFTAPSTIA